MKKFLLFLPFILSSLASFSQTGIGTKTVDPSAILELKSPSKGFLPTRVQLTGAIDAVTIPSPATGLIVFHTGITGMDAGVYSNVGTPGSPSWTRGGAQPVDETQGTRVYKVKYLGRNIDTESFPKPTLKIPDLNIELRFAVVGANNYLQLRLTAAPSQTVNVKSSAHWQGANHPTGTDATNSTYTFTSGNYSAWQNLNGVWNGWWAYLYYITTDEPSSTNKAFNLYGVCSYGNQGSNIGQEQYVLAGEVF